MVTAARYNDCPAVPGRRPLPGPGRAPGDGIRRRRDLEPAEGGDPYADAKSVRDTVVPKMVDLRTLGDKLETMVADDLWPLPTSQEMRDIL